MGATGYAPPRWTAGVRSYDGRHRIRAPRWMAGVRSYDGCHRIHAPQVDGRGAVMPHGSGRSAGREKQL